jgi:S-adenosylmethionine synthetase
MRDFVLSSESVTAGHPDKLCDQISDAVIDACLTQDPSARAVVECAISSGVVFVSLRGLATPPCDLGALAAALIADAGYPARAMPPPTLVLDLDPGGPEVRSGRRGHMTTAFGYACDQTPEAMPYALWAAHRLTRALAAARADGRLGWLAPDAQAQVAVRFEDRRPVAIPAVAIAYGTLDVADPAASEAELRAAVIVPAFHGAPLCPDAATRIVCLPTGGGGGPAAHAGQTGRKMADDTYGGHARQSAAALSGKGPDRIDRVAQFAAREAARTAVAAGLARECEVQLCYLLGEAVPASLVVETFGSGTMEDARLAARIGEVFDFRGPAIVERLGLARLPATRGGRFYRDLAVGGQMGRSDLDAPWERLDMVGRLA